MSRLRVNPNSFQSNYQESARALLELAIDLPDRPSPDQTHDLRVTARRIQVMLRLLPKTVRYSPDARKFDLALKSILKATSQLRDLDTLMDTLSFHKENLAPQLFISLENKRSDAAASAKTSLATLAETKTPVLDSLLQGKKLSRRLRKRIRNRGEAVVELLRKILKDESKVGELHALRKEVKKLRYLLELASERPPELSILTNWQESLGVIHDLDVAMGYLQQSRLDFAKERALQELRHSRHTDYLKFVAKYRTDSIDTLGESEFLAGGPIPGLG